MAGDVSLRADGETRTCTHFQCGAELVEMPDDPALPSHVELLQCAGCDEVYEFDTETGELEVAG